MSIVFQPPLIKGTLVKRQNRFVAQVMVDNDKHLAHVPNTGRMKEFMVPGADVWIRPATTTGRKTAYDLLLIREGESMVYIDSRGANQMIYEAINRGELAKYFPVVKDIKREVVYGNSRMDMAVFDGYYHHLIEIKCVTLVKEGRAMFPDAPTQRGTKHIKDLIRAVEEGYKSWLVFVVQRQDGTSFSSNHSTDPLFSETVKYGASKGVNLLALNCVVDTSAVALNDVIDIFL
ncbi:MAG TPA: DNA/RNA nuclease SfsA [Clostridiales bacterium]|nr:DNA/RNA nuclease SfsA [Clostridiales bacterium]